MAPLLRYFRYHENVVFNISRAGGLRRQRSSWACPHGETCGEEHGNYSEERRAQHCEGHKESCAHCGQHVHAIVEAPGFETKVLFARPSYDCR